MSQPNPFAAPQVIQAPPQKQATVVDEGIWSDGKLLVVSRRALLPPVCVLTNQEPKRSLKRTYYWHHPAVFLSIFAGLLIYVILALVLRKSQRIDLPLSETALKKRKTALLVCWFFGLLFVAGIVGSFIALASETFGHGNGWIGGLLSAGSFVGLLITAVIGGRYAGVLKPKKITEDYGWFKGASPEYLKRFPALPPNFR